jgi:hypothetical protein
VTKADLSPRDSALLLSVSDKILLFGGFAKGDAVHPLNSGAIFDAASHQWSRIPDAPFAAPFRQVAGVSDGKEVIVLHTMQGGARR